MATEVTIQITNDVLFAVDESGAATDFNILVDGEIVATVPAKEPKFTVLADYVSGEFSFTPGMTWEAWIASDYNDGNFSINVVDHKVRYFSESIGDEHRVRVLPNELVKATTYYGYFGW